MPSPRVAPLFLIPLLCVSAAAPAQGCHTCGRPGRPPKPNPAVPGRRPTPATPPRAGTCPVDALKLGACVDLIGGLVHLGVGDPRVVNQCCPLLQGLAQLDAAVCLCTTLKLKLLNINLYLPLALQLFLTCGQTPPSGYTCTLDGVVPKVGG